MTYKFATVNGTQIHYDDQGTGPVLVLIHAAISDLRMWEAQMASFTKSFRVIRYDIRGWGKSIDPPGGYSDYDDLQALLVHLGIDKAIVLGNSFGGQIALDFALAYPEMVQGLLLVGPAVGGYNFLSDDISATEEEMEAKYGAGDLQGAAELEMQIWYDGPRRDSSQVEPNGRARALELCLYLFELPEGEGKRQTLEPTAVTRLSAINVPVLLVIGKEDVNDIHRIADLLVEELPNVQRVDMPDTAHLPNMERPEQFNQIAMDFLHRFTEKVITNIEQISVEWLTAVLTRSGALQQGSVASFELGTGHGNWSTSANLAVNYSVNAQGPLPRRVFLKMVDTEKSSADEYFGDSEVTYYTHDYVDVQNAPLLHCYDGAYSEKLERYHILLDDVSETHIEAAEKEPTFAYGMALAEGLAILHARWWGARRLAEAGASMHSAEHIQHNIAIAEPGVGHILGQFSAKLTPHWPELLHEIYAKHPQALIKRTQDVNGFTIVHGDVGHNNVLVPRKAERPIYIIDRQPFNWSLTTWLGVYDFAYAIVLDWDIEKRRQYEMPILKHYHKHLIANGVSDYSWQQLYDDYRLCVPMCVYIATEYCRGGANNVRRIPIWMPKLKRSLTACDDLDCSALWR